MKAKIFEIKRFAVHDGDGIRTTVFFKGCPLKCIWCHNPEGISFDSETAFYKNKCIGCRECQKEGFMPSDCPSEARTEYGKDVTIEELLPKLLEDREFFEESGGGITLSGGECLCQANFCAELLKRLKEEGINTAIDTCGFVSRDAICKVLPYTDTFLYDVKAIDKSIHIRCTGQPNTLILDNLKYIDSYGKNIEVRIPFVPEFNGDETEQIAIFLKDIKNLVGVRLLPYHNYAGTKYDALSLKNTLPEKMPTDDEIRTAKNILISHGLPFKD